MEKLLKHLTKAVGNPAALFKYNPKSNDPLAVCKGLCGEFNSLGLTVTRDTITLFDKLGGTKPSERVIDVSDFMWAKSKKNQITFAVGQDEYAITYAPL